MEATIVFCVFLSCYLIYVNFHYHKTISIYEKTLEVKITDNFQKLQKQYDELFRQFQEKNRKEFAEKLKAEYEKACENIRFNEIEYKKTITKKRKEFNRKHGKDANPERIWRYLDDEQEEEEEEE